MLAGDMELAVANMPRKKKKTPSSDEWALLASGIPNRYARPGFGGPMPWPTAAGLWPGKMFLFF
jgi:hypothetical protein